MWSTIGGGIILRTGHGRRMKAHPDSGLNSSLTFAMRTPPDNHSADPAGLTGGMKPYAWLNLKARGASQGDREVPPMVEIEMPRVAPAGYAMGNPPRAL